MSPTNFDALAKQHPKYQRALRRLATWLDAHADAAIINPIALAKDVPEVDIVALAEALTLLVQNGWLRRVYKVLTPNGVLAEGEFDDPSTIPARLPDRRENYFDTAEADVIPVFRRVA
jgi:hypothetical protein